MAGIRCHSKSKTPWKPYESDNLSSGGSPVADGPEPVAHAGCVDLDPQRDDEIEKLEDGLADANEQIEDLKNEIESIKDSISEALQLIDD